MATSQKNDRMDRDVTPSNLDSDHPARDRLYEQARGVSRDVQEMGGLASAAAQEQLGQMGDSAAAYYGQGRDRVYQVERGVEQYIREQPLTSMLIAAGIGALAGAAGVLYSRRRIRR
jgi:ElaB/YqjD/DUF883 family membrane-anchored ribosome-binding protein